MSWDTVGRGYSTEPARVKLFVSIRVLLDTIAIWLPPVLISTLELRVVQAIRLKHHDLIVALIVLVLRVVSDSALGRDLARPFRWVQIVLVLILVVCILVFVLILSLHFLANHRRFALGEAASDSAWAEITAIW